MKIVRSIAVILTLFCSAPTIAQVVSTPPETFDVTDSRLELLLSCPTDHHRLYVLQGEGQFSFTDIASDGGVVDERKSDRLIDVEDFAWLVASVFESPFSYLPAVVGDRTYMADGRVVSGFKPELSTGCSAKLSIQVGTYLKTVQYEKMALLPAGLLMKLQEYSGEG